MRAPRTLAIAIVSALALLLATPALAERRGQAPPPRLPRNALRVPLVSQSTSYSCGAGALVGVLYYWKAYDGPERPLHRALRTTARSGTRPQRIVAVARQYGLRAALREKMTLGDLRRALGRGDTVILDLQAWRDGGGGARASWSATWEDGHYSVLVGMDDHHAYFMDPSAHFGYGTMPLRELRERWHDYEAEGGRTRRYFNSGIVIHGADHVSGGLVRME